MYEPAGSGRGAEYRGDLAERTLIDLFDSWLTGANALPPSRYMPDSQKIDIQITVPSLWSEVEGIKLNWQVKTVARKPPVVVDPSLGCEVFQYQIKRRDLQGLYEASRSDQTLYLALALPKEGQRATASLVDLPPSERFDWFAVDLKQYFKNVDWKGSQDLLYVPVANRLNLATFSLVWGSHWVERFFGPLQSRELLQVPGLSNRISQMLRPDQGAALASEHGWDFLLKDLPKYQKEFEPDLFKQINFRAGLLDALNIIQNQLSDAAERMDQIRIYAPEALYGTANLWLFAKSYYGFMSGTGAIAHGRDNFMNQRLLPLAADSVLAAPRVLLCALWHVTLCYRALGSDVLIVPRPGVDPGTDHSYYGGGIGYFPWLTLTPDQANWVVKSEDPDASSAHLDFIVSHSRETVVDGRHNVLEAAVALGLDPDQLKLPLSCPVLLFQPESAFVRHPRELFDRARHARGG